jgi:hypothetical protein
MVFLAMPPDLLCMGLFCKKQFRVPPPRSRTDPPPVARAAAAYGDTDEDALKRATPLFHEGLNRIEVWCGSRKVGDIPPRQNEVSERGAIRGCA